MADIDTPPAVYVATAAATFDHGVLNYTIVPGTTFAAGHPVLAAHPDLFKPFIPDYDWAPRSAVKAGHRDARTR